MLCADSNLTVKFELESSQTITTLCSSTEMIASGSKRSETKLRAPKKLRSACDGCHQGKVRCSGGSPCEMCESLEADCVYSVSNRIGRPKGTKNKKTLERFKQDTDDAARNADLGHLHDPKQSTKDVSSADIPPYLSMSELDFCNDIESLDVLSVPSNYDPLLSFLDSMESWPPHENVRTEFTEEQNECAAPGSTSITSPTFSFAGSNLDADTLAQLCREDSMSSYYSTPSFNNLTSEAQGIKNHKAYVLENIASQNVSSNTHLSSVSRKSLATTSPTDLGLSDDRETDTPMCECLQNHVGLLRRLKELQGNQTLRIDTLLVRAKESINAWHTLLQCNECRQDDDQEVLILSAMSIRVFIRVFVRSLQNSSHSENAASEDQFPYDIEGINGVSSVRNTRQSPVSSSSCTNRRSSSSKVIKNLSSSPSVVANLGVFEITGADRAAVAQVLLLRILEQLKSVLAGLNQRLELLRWQGERIYLGEKRQSLGQSHAADNILENHVDGDGLGYLQALLKSLEGSIQGLSQKMHTFPVMFAANSDNIS